MRRIISKYILIIITCIYIFCTTVVLGVENYINFIELEGQNDLSQSVINCMLQDGRGYMWFGTNNGLTKYDGYKTYTYRQIPFDENTILDNYIIAIEEDLDGNIWIGTNKGLTKFDPIKNIFKHYKDNSITNNRITTILEDKKGEIWIGTDGGGLNQYNKEEDIFIKHDKSLSSDYITTLYEDKDENIWIGTQKGLDKLDEDSLNTLTENHITTISQDKYGHIWVGTLKHGLKKINIEHKSINTYLEDEKDSYSVGSNSITSIIKDNRGTIWIGSKNGGLAKYDEENDLFIKRTSNFKSRSNSSDNNILSLYQDSTGLIWVGLESGGVIKFNPHSSFLNYNSVASFKNIINDNNILSMYKDKQGILWLGTKNGGVNRLDFNEKTVDYYIHNVNDANSITSNTVNSITEDSEGIMWIGTESGLNRFDRESNKFTRYLNDSKDSKTIISNKVNYIYEDSNKTLWIGTSKGLDIYDRENNRFIHYNNLNSDLSDNYITTIYEDGYNEIWIGTLYGGLNKYDKYKNTFKVYKNISDNKSTISNDHITSIVEDNTRNLWIGTVNGLNKFNRKDEAFKVFTEKEQIKSNFISGLLVDYRGNLWISSNSGICKFSTREEKLIKSYSTMDGLQGNYFNIGAIYKSYDEQLIFGGTNGFNTIYPNREIYTYNKPNIIVNTFKVNDIEINIDENKDIILPYNQNRFYFEFLMTDYKKPSGNRFSFKLEGHDTNWTEVDTRNYGVYNNIKPGKYTLKIKGVNSEGVWNQQGVEIDIRIKPPFWKTKLAYFIYFVILILTTYVISNYVKLLEKMVSERTYELNQTNEQLKQTIEENKRLFDDKMEIENFRNDFFVNLSHELRAPLSMILSIIQLSGTYLKGENLNESVEKLGNHFKLINKNCYRLLKIVNNIIDVSKLEAKQYRLDLKKINIVYLVEEVVLSVVEHAKHKNIEILFDTQSEEEIVDCDPVEIERVILNIMSNAIKYNKEYGNIWVNIYVEKQIVKVSIKDNGIGIPKKNQDTIFEKFKRVEKSSLGSGVGLSLTKLLLEMHRGKIEFESEEGKGSEFIVSLPLYDAKEGEYIYEMSTEGIELEIEMSEIN